MVTFWLQAASRGSLVRACTSETRESLKADEEGVNGDYFKNQRA